MSQAQLTELDDELADIPVSTIILSRDRYEQIITDGVRVHHDFYTGAMGCIRFVLSKPDCTVAEIRTIVEAMEATRDAWITARATERLVPAGVEGYAIEGRAR